MYRMEDGRGLFASLRLFLGWPLWDLYLVLESSFQYSWIIFKKAGRKRVSYAFDLNKVYASQGQHLTQFY